MTFKDKVEFVWCSLYSIFLPMIRRFPRRAVLYYHGLNDAEVGNFEKQMEYLVRHCQVVKVSEILTNRTNNSKFMVGLTFDDAFVSIFKNAVPILKKYDLPAAVFAPTGNLGRRLDWPVSAGCQDAQEIVMDKDQIRELDSAGFEIFSHTVSHPRLTEITGEKIHEELTESKHVLERIVGHEIGGISYPNGSCDSEVIGAAERAGYKVGFTIEPCLIDSSTHSLRIGRFSVYGGESLLMFKIKVSGAYQAVRYLRKLKHLFVRKQ